MYVRAREVIARHDPEISASITTFALDFIGFFVVQSCNLAITLDGFLNRFFDVDLLFLLGYVQLTKLLAESLGVCADKSEDLLNIGIRELRDILVEKCIRLLFASYRIMTFGEYFSMSERLLLLNALHLLLLLGFPNVRKNCIVRSHSLFASANDCGASSKEVITFGSPLMLSPN